MKFSPDNCNTLVDLSCTNKADEKRFKIEILYVLCYFAQKINDNPPWVMPSLQEATERYIFPKKTKRNSVSPQLAENAPRPLPFFCVIPNMTQIKNLFKAKKKCCFFQIQPNLHFISIRIPNYGKVILDLDLSGRRLDVESYCRKNQFAVKDVLVLIEAIKKFSVDQILSFITNKEDINNLDSILSANIATLKECVKDNIEELQALPTLLEYHQQQLISLNQQMELLEIKKNFSLVNDLTAQSNLKR